jgi:Zn-finger nucleic acid-binding protein
MEERIAMLLALANVAPDEFEEQAEKAADTLERREHWTPPPAAGGAGRTIGLTTAATPPPATAATSPAAPAVMTCPGCGSALVDAPYEGISIVVCPACGGRLVSSEDVAKLLARRDVAFTEEQVRLAELLAADGNRLRHAARLGHGRSDAALIACPRCAATMMRRHYSYDYAVEIDYCSLCDLFWFEKDELEGLQLLVEGQAG